MRELLQTGIVAFEDGVVVVTVYCGESDMANVHETQVGRFRVSDAGVGAPRALKDGSSALSADDLARLELRAAITVLHDVDRIGGEELRFARKALNLRQVDLAELLDVRGETVSRWETGAEEFPRQAQLAVLALLTEMLQHGELRRPIVSASDGAKMLKAAV